MRFTQRMPRRLAFHTLEDRAVPASLTQFFTTEHIDLGLGFTGGPTGEWSLHAHDHDAAIEADPDDALLYVSTTAQATRPAGSEFDFIGVAAGASYYRLSQTQNANALFLGIAGDEIVAGSLDRYDPAAESGNRVSGLGRWAKMSLVNVAGPGQFSVWQNGDTTPTVFMSSNDGITTSDALWVISGGHSHYNFGFTQPGRYAITVQLSGYLDDGNTSVLGTPTQSEPLTFYVSVGNVGQLQFDASSYQVNEGAGTATLTVQRLGGSDGQLTVDYTTANGTALAGVDYTTTSGTLTFADLETTKTIVVPIINDSADEPNETVNLILSNAGPASIRDYRQTVESINLLGANSSVVLSIVNDDAPGSNTPPTINDVSDQATNEDTPTGTINFTVGDTQSALTDLVVSATSSNTTLVPNANIVFGGSGANRTVTLTPTAEQSGTTTITLTVQDTGGLTASDTFVLTVNAVNDAPSANGQTVATRQDEAVNVTLSGSDPENDLLTFNIGTPPANGVLSGSGANRTYTPNTGFVGQDTFTFVANDGNADSTPATVTVNVTLAQAPEANPDTFTLGTGNQLFGNVLNNDRDLDGDPITASVETNPAHGSLVLNADGSFTYEPNSTFVGADTFTYRVTDNTNRSSTATATINAAGTQVFEAVYTEGDIDIGVAYEDGWDLHIHNEEAEIEHEPDGALFYVAPEALTTRPASSQFDFLGIAAGADYYRLPQVQNPELLFLGFGTEEIAAGTFVGGSVAVTLQAVNGPGQFAVWQAGDTGPNVFWTTADGINAQDTLTLLEGAHTHFNLGFTAKGRYEVTVVARGLLDNGSTTEEVSVPATYYFSVDNLGNVAFEQSSIGVAEGKTVTVKVTRTGGSDGPMAVAYQTLAQAAGTGLASATDYLPASGVLDFADGETTKLFTFATKKDARNEPIETVQLALNVPDEGFAMLGSTTLTTVSIDKPTTLKVAKVTVNDGVKQRSNMETLSIRFNRDTNLAALVANGTITDAVKLFNGTTQVTLSLNRFHYDAAKNTLTIGLTQGVFDPRTPTILTNGRYELRLDTTLVQSAAGGMVLSDTDKTVDGTQRFAFHRLEGDANGDRKITKTDVSAVKKLQNVSLWQRRYNFAYDFNADGIINQLDLTYVNALIGTSI